MFDACILITKPVRIEMAVQAVVHQHLYLLLETHFHDKKVHIWNTLDLYIYNIILFMMFYIIYGYKI